MVDVERFIATIRDSFVGSQQVYAEGSCYHFYLILKEVFPEAKCWYDIDHIITEINGKFYDITGEVLHNTAMYKFNDLPHYSLKHPYNIYKNKQ